MTRADLDFKNFTVGVGSRSGNRLVKVFTVVLAGQDSDLD